MTQPTAPERLLRRLAVLPDACRAMDAAFERLAARGGGELIWRITVNEEGLAVAMEPMLSLSRFERRVESSCGGAT